MPHERRVGRARAGLAAGQPPRPPGPHPGGVGDLGARAAARRRRSSPAPRSAGSAARSWSPRSSRSLNAIIPPLLAALRLPFTVGLGFLAVLAADAAALLIAADAAPQHLYVDGFGSRARRLAPRLGGQHGGRRGRRHRRRRDATPTASPAASRGAPARRIATDAPGIVFLEIDGLALPVLRRAIRDGTTPVMARWLADGSHRLIELGDRPLLADGREPGGDPARRQPRHPRVPVGRQGRPGRS